jgi:AraC family transcriptional regulator
MLYDPKQKQLHVEYTARLNEVIDYIEDNISQDLTLEMLAGVANFSKYHFHRIFRTMTGETLNQFISRIRVQKAAGQLLYNRKKSVTEIALDCGYSGSAAFARAFKETYGMSATTWRAGGYQQFQRKIRKPERNPNQTNGTKWKDFTINPLYIDPVSNNLTWRINMIDKKAVKVEVTEMADMPVAYIRHIGPYAGDGELFGKLFEQLFTWAGPRGLLQNPEMQVLSVYHDDPEITPDENLRVEVCISVPEDTAVDGQIGKMTIPGGQYAVANFELGMDEYGEAWQLVYGEWLPQSGFQPDDRPCFERYLNDPQEHPEHKHIVDICVPVKPL